MVMANGDETHGGGQTSDRSCTDVERILRNDLYRKPFQQFLEQQFCAENINFYMAVEEYRSIPDTDLERRAKTARQIFERHFSPNSVEPVNIDNSTSKSIRDAVMSQNFTSQLYDVAQYQIFHLLKYDCWPRYLRAGGVAPTFDDGSDETSGTPTTSAPVPRQHRGDKKRKSLIWHGLRPRFSRRKKAWSDGDGSLAHSCDSSESSVRAAAGQFSTSQPESRMLPLQEQFGRIDNSRASLPLKLNKELRFGTLSKYGSLRRRGFTVSGKQRSEPTETSRAHSSAQQQSTSSFAVTEVCTKFCTLMLNDAPCVEQIALRDPSESVGKWTAAIAAKRGMDPRATEVVDAQTSRAHSSAQQQSTSSFAVTEVCTKFCTLMLNDAPCVEQIALRDPSESVGKWTAAIAAKRGMDPRATEVVDAQSGATIDPARQAVDALNNRCVRLLPVLHFAAEIIIPTPSNKTGTCANTRYVSSGATIDPARQAVDALNNRCVRLLPVLHFAAEIIIPTPSNKTGTCANTRFVLLRARHGLSLNAALRPVLAKYLIDYDSCVVVLPSSFDAVSGQTTVEKRLSPKRETAKELHSTQFITPEKNLPFYQHGDVAFVELPADYDLRTGKVNATRSYSNAKTEHTSGLLKFVRKASQAVTSREPSSSSDGAGPCSSQQHSAGHSYSQSVSSRDYADRTRFISAIFLLNLHNLSSCLTVARIFVPQKMLGSIVSY
ncbi:unnamed protein product [Gongylonema pulchrum]|uniref:RGS domain-containing protein n=1 Tax=Gongylonema pulchrum TaxID=637853 RepID=A0A183DNX9_9BILA|nr:unnamed protein product [Gongylonema pulchrum]